MQLVALFCQDPDLAAPFKTLGVPEYFVHWVSTAQAIGESLGALETLNFAGALILDESQQSQAFDSLQRSSLDAQAAGVVDSITVTAAGLMGDYTLGRALGHALQSEGWDARGARAAILGSGPVAKSVAQELSSRGAQHITVLGANRPAAETSLPTLASASGSEARAADEPLAAPLLEQADILVRTDPKLTVSQNVLGPHLSIIDLAPSPLSDLRKAGLKVGAKSFGLRDVQAHQTALALSHILGKRLELEPFLTLFHEQTF